LGAEPSGQNRSAFGKGRKYDSGAIDCQEFLS
jgi:hypothetical protein